MMTRIIRLSVLFFLYILLASDSCSRDEQYDEGRREKAAEQTRDSLVSEFTSDKLTDEDLSLFEESAIQRFEDLIDLSAIAADTSLAGSFRAEASVSLRKLFISDRNVLSIYPGEGKQKMTVPLVRHATDSATPAWTIRIARPDSVWVASGLVQVSDSLYEGQLGFSRATSAPEAHPCLAAGRMDFFLVKCSRPFGNDTLKVWTIALGDSY